MYGAGVLRLTDKSTFSINSLRVKNELCTGLGECAMRMLIHFVPSIHGQESNDAMELMNKQSRISMFWLKMCADI